MKLKTISILFYTLINHAISDMLPCLNSKIAIEPIYGLANVNHIIFHTKKNCAVRSEVPYAILSSLNVIHYVETPQSVVRQKMRFIHP